MSDLAYDTGDRRDTPLALGLKDRIAREGPIAVSDYMRACLQDPEHGYYRRRSAIGRGGDFITAPEISQIFGELIGLWCVVAWQQMGARGPFNLVELGPGRGTLMRDVLRAARVMPDFLAAADVVLVECSETLEAAQREALAAHGPQARWVRHPTLVPPGPSIVIANEYLDALPIEQLVRQGAGWLPRGVGLDADGALAFTTLDAKPVLLLPELAGRPPGTILERRQTMDQTFALDRLAKGGPLAALFIDYGHGETAAGDTLQAVRGQRYEHALTSPGEADLTAHVDFAAFLREARTWELATNGPVTQAEFLGALGIVERASRLMAANPGRAAEIEAGVARLMSPSGMGTRFKAVGIRSPALPALPGFPGMDTGPRSK